MIPQEPVTDMISRHQAVVMIPCEEHGPHFVVVSGRDEVAWVCARHLMEHLPFEGIEVQEYVVTVWDRDGINDLPF